MAYTKIFNDSIYTSYQFVQDGVAGSRITSLSSLPGTRTGSRVADRKAKIAAGSQAGSVFTSDRQSVKSVVNGSASLSYIDTSVSPSKLHTKSFSGIRFSPASPPALSLDTVSVDNKALVKILKKIRASHQQMEGATFLAELHQTIGMLKRPLSAMRDEVNRYLLSLENTKRKVKRLPAHKRRAEWQRALSGTWLELQWGWRPLISDTKAIATTIARMLNEPPHKERLSATSALDTETTEMADTGISENYFEHKYVKVRKREYSTRYVVGMSSVRKAHASGVQRVIDLCGFNPEDFIPALYEVLPWSWLVDYFSNVGDIIEAGATSLTDVQWIVKTTRDTREEQMTVTQKNTELYIQQISNGYFKPVKQTLGSFGQSHTIRKLVNRTLPITLGVPQFRLESPFEAPLKMLNMLSVVDQRRKRVQDLTGIPRAAKHTPFASEYTHL